MLYKALLGFDSIILDVYGFETYSTFPVWFCNTKLSKCNPNVSRPRWGKMERIIY